MMSLAAMEARIIGMQQGLRMALLTSGSMSCRVCGLVQAGRASECFAAGEALGEKE